MTEQPATTAPAVGTDPKAVLEELVRTSPCTGWEHMVRDMVLVDISRHEPAVPDLGADPLDVMYASLLNAAIAVCQWLLTADTSDLTPVRAGRASSTAVALARHLIVTRNSIFDREQKASR